MDAATLAAAAGIPIERAEHWAGYITDAMDQFGIRTPRCQAAFIAQTAHETGGYKRWVENLNYSTPELIYRNFSSRFNSIDEARHYVRSPKALASRAYSNKGGNGSEASGDGWRYRGRGLIQVTFKNAYEACGIALGVDLLAQPELLEREDYAALSAGWYWDVNNLNTYAEAGMIQAVSGVINRGSPTKIALGDAERTEGFERAFGVLA